MSEDLVFYTNPMSRGRMARWMLEEVGVPYRTEVMDYASTMKAPAYLAINPMGKVPALKHGEVVVTEVAAICAYLADAFPEAGLAPPVGSPARGPYYRWLFYGAGVMEPAIVNTALKVEVPPERRAMAGYGSMAQVLDTLENLCARHEYLAGDKFSAADLYIGAELGWGMMFGMLEKRPAMEAYANRMAARPAAQRAREIDDKLIADAKAATA